MATLDTRSPSTLSPGVAPFYPGGTLGGHTKHRRCAVEDEDDDGKDSNNDPQQPTMMLLVG
jgi:hypothetical protein